MLHKSEGKTLCFATRYICWILRQKGCSDYAFSCNAFKSIANSAVKKLGPLALLYAFLRRNYSSWFLLEIVNPKLPSSKYHLDL